MKVRTLTLALLAALVFIAQPVMAQNGRPAQVGTIMSMDGGTFTLRDGVRVYINPGTVVKPTGTYLHPGMSVAVLGHFENDGAMDADIIYLGRYDEQGRLIVDQQRGWYDQDGYFHANYGPGWYDREGNFHQGY